MTNLVASGNLTSSDLVATESRSLAIHTIDDLSRIGKMMAASGFFADCRDAAQAGVKIMAGMELGFPAFASLVGIQIIKGKPVMGANLQAAAIKKSGKYNYRVLQHTNEVCRIEFFERINEWVSVGESEFTADDAKLAGLVNADIWRKYPKNMLFARAISNGVKFYCPDLFLGAPVYTPDELEDQVTEVAAAPPSEVRRGRPPKSTGTPAAPQAPNQLWAKTPDQMLAKCAEAQCLTPQAQTTPQAQAVTVASVPVATEPTPQPAQEAPDEISDKQFYATAQRLGYTKEAYKAALISLGYSGGTATIPQDKRLGVLETLQKRMESQGMDTVVAAGSVAQVFNGHVIEDPEDSEGQEEYDDEAVENEAENEAEDEESYDEFLTTNGN